MNNDPIIVDFETTSISKRPAYPPKPVGVSIRGDRTSPKKSEYLRWGHPSGNNCDVGTARQRLKDAYVSGRPVVFHNEKFDLDVGETHLALPIPPRHQDTMFLGFLNNPREITLSLKPMSQKYLDEPPEEQDRLREWILSNIKGAKKNDWGSYIADAPGDIVEPYACGDTDRTLGLYDHLLPLITYRGMGEAYERELALTTTTLEMERSGVRVDMRRLYRAKRVFEKMLKVVEGRIRKRLKVSETFKFGSPVQLADALIKRNLLPTIIRTPTGKVSTKIEHLEANCSDKTLVGLLATRSIAVKYLETFINPWLLMGEKTGGRITPTFNQTRNRTDEGGGGSRSGRFSSNDPNMQQVSSNVEESKNRINLERMQRMLLQEFHYKFIGMRDFILPDEGMILISADYSQQELRLLAHFEQSVLMQGYIKDPRMDVHDYIRKLIEDITGTDYGRKAIKIIVFGIIYGMGVNKLAAGLGLNYNEAKHVQDALFRAVPGLENLQKKLKKMSRQEIPLRTWGGREYFCEEPFYWKDKDRWLTFEYKMLNYLIQPSAADMTKQGMIQVHQRVPEVRIALQVHDELVCMAPHRKFGPKIAAAMCDMKLNVPMLVDCKYSEESWARLKEAA